MLWTPDVLCTGTEPGPPVAKCDIDGAMAVANPGGPPGDSMMGESPPGLAPPNDPPGDFVGDVERFDGTRRCSMFRKSVPFAMSSPKPCECEKA